MYVASGDFEIEANLVRAFLLDVKSTVWPGCKAQMLGSNSYLPEAYDHAMPLHMLWFDHEPDFVFHQEKFGARDEINEFAARYGFDADSLPDFTTPNKGGSGFEKDLGPALEGSVSAKIIGTVRDNADLRELFCEIYEGDMRCLGYTDEWNEYCANLTLHKEKVVQELTSELDDFAMTLSRDVKP